MGKAIAVIIGLIATSLVPSSAHAQSAPVLGFNDHPLDNRTPADAATMLDRVQQLGGQKVRINVHWSWLEWARPGRDGWNAEQIQRLDTYLNEAAERGIAVQLAVLGTPCWAAAGPARDCSSAQVREAAHKAAPRSEADYAAFVLELVRFAGGRAQYVGVGNEPNHPWFWEQPDPAAYTRLLRATYDAVKSTDPEVAVVAGALAPGRPAGARLDTLAFLREMYANGARGAFDYFEYHPYTDGHSPDWFDQNWPLFSFQHAVQGVRAEMLANGDDSPMILGEAGWTTVDSASCADCGGLDLGVSADEQAMFLARALEIAQDWPFVHSVVIYELADQGPSDSRVALDHFGVLDRQLRPKPAASAVANTIAAMRSEVAGIRPAGPE